MSDDDSGRRSLTGPGPLDFDNWTVDGPFYSSEFKYAVEAGPPVLPVGLIRMLDTRIDVFLAHPRLADQVDLQLVRFENTGDDRASQASRAYLQGPRSRILA
jgi:hypothetical protein